MSAAERSAKILRRYVPGVGLGLVFAILAAFTIRWVSANRGAAAPRKGPTINMVRLTPPTPPPKATPPPRAPEPAIQPKVVEQAPIHRVELKPEDVPPPDAPRPPSDAPPGGGRLAMAAEGDGPGDAFNLVGNPGGRGLLSGGGLGDGTGEIGGDERRFGWYYTQIKLGIEEVFRKQKKLSMASTRVELRVWVDGEGRVSRVQLIRSTGDPEVDQALQSVAGLKLKEPPPPGIHMPMVARFTALRPR
jgi:protein TonB